MWKELRCQLAPQAPVMFKLPCPNCGKERTYSRKASFDKALKQKTVCSSCRTSHNNRKRKGTKQKENNPAWRGYKDIPGKVISKLRRDAKTRDIEFHITLEDIWYHYEKQEKRCALSGVLLEWGTNASVDRIDSSKHYTKDNIQIVHKVINIMKRDLDQDEFVRFCCNVSSRYYNSFLNNSRPQ